MQKIAIEDDAATFLFLFIIQATMHFEFLSPELLLILLRHARFDPEGL